MTTETKPGAVEREFREWYGGEPSETDREFFDFTVAHDAADVAIVRQLVEALWGWQLYAEDGGVNLDDHEEGGLFREGDAALTAARVWLEGR